MAKRDLASAKRIAFQLLKFRSRSRQEIYDRLKRKGFTEEIISQVISFLERLKYLNDAEFALSFSQSRLAKPIGLRRIAFELEQKGISQEIIEQTLEKIKPGYLEVSIVEKIAKEKFKKMHSLDKYKAKSRIYALLMRKGFNSELVKQVIDSL